MKIVIGSDFHGNPHHIAQIEKVVRDVGADIFIYAGDLGPNRVMYGDPIKQQEYVVQHFFNEVVKVKCPRKYVIPGNTDFQLAIDHYKKSYDDP